MSILWCGGEDIDFPLGAPVSTTVDTGYYTIALSRCAISRTLDTSGWCLSSVFTKEANPWVHVVRGGLQTCSSNVSLFAIIHSATGRGFRIGVSPTIAGKLTILSYDGTTITTLAAETGVSLASGKQTLDLKISNYGSSGTVDLYCNGAIVATYTGNISITGVDGFDQVGIIGYVHPANYSAAFSQIIIADEDTRLMTLKSLIPNADGDLNEWTGVYSNIDEETLSDADTVYTNIADETFLCNLSGMPTGNFICKGVKITSRATDGVGGLGIQLGIKTNSTVSLGDSVTLDVIWQTYESLYQQNPVTFNRFTPTDIEALQFAVKSVSV